jgi:hypothetical protein
MEPRSSLLCSNEPCHWSLFWGTWTQSTPSHHTKIRSNIILPPVCSSLASGLISSGVQTKILDAFFISSMRATWSTHLIVLDIVTLILCGEEWNIWRSSLCIFLQSPVTSSLWVANFIPSTLVSNILILCSSFNVRDYVLETKWMVTVVPRI